MNEEPDKKGTVPPDEIQKIMNGLSADAPPNGTPPDSNNNTKNIGLALVPFTPVPFTGKDALYSWGRLIAYGGLAALTYKKSKNLSYLFGAAAGVSLLTSLSANSWGK